MRGIRLVAIAGLALLLAGCAVGRGLQTVELLSNLAGQEMPAGVDRKARPFTVAGRTHEADLYAPAAWWPRAALVLVPGASPAGRDDPRLVAFAGTLAKAGFRVLVPEIPALRRMTLSAADSEIVADALRHLAADGDGFLGVVALSYAVGPAMLAAHRPDLAAEVDVLVGIGGYHDVEAVGIWFTTGWYRVPGEGPGAQPRWRQGSPNAFGKWMFLRANANRVSDPQDRRLLQRMAERRLEDPDADLSGLVPQLGPEGRSVHAFLTNGDRDRAPALIAALPAPVREEMRALDLSRRRFDPQGPHLILVHGRNDPIIPYTESLALAGAVRGPDGSPRAELHLVDGIGHVEAGGMTFDDARVLAEAVYSLLAHRDRR